MEDNCVDRRVQKACLCGSTTDFTLINHSSDVFRQDTADYVKEVHTMEWLLAIGCNIGGGASDEERVKLIVGVLIQLANNPLSVENVPAKYIQGNQDDPYLGFRHIIPYRN